jgi:hypothetical protein
MSNPSLSAVGAMWQASTGSQRQAASLLSDGAAFILPPAIHVTVQVVCSFSGLAELAWARCNGSMSAVGIVPT